ncbi:transcription-repair coupling factor [Rhodospirillaceae bacterium SYSU D60014]|uniref:transcription-repair coupling factor n=1 Tax=Virgifigura deserti TaxID=2268457 RepID=UPI000E661901
MPSANKLRYAPVVDFDRPAITGIAEPPEGVAALILAEWASALGTRGLLFAARSEGRARRIARAAQGFAPGLEVLVLPSWDCLPYDRASPSRAVMGERITVLRRLAKPPGADGRLLLAPVDTLLQRIPPRRVWSDARLEIAVGQPLPLEDLKVYLIQTGYHLDERVDEPGEAAIRGAVIDLFPGNEAQPYRLDIADGGVTTIRRYDAYTQRSDGETQALTLQPVSEVLLDANLVRRFLRSDKTEMGAEAQPAEGILDGTPEMPCRIAGLEHWLPQFHDALETLFDCLPKAPLVLDADTDSRRAAAIEQVADAYERRLARPAMGRADRTPPDRTPLRPDRLYLDEAAWRDRTADRAVLSFDESVEQKLVSDAIPGPRFTEEDDRLGSFARHVEARRAAGGHVILTAEAEPARRRLARWLERRLGIAVTEIERWADIAFLPKDGIASLALELDRGFLLPGLAVVTAADVDGDRMRVAVPLPRAGQDAFAGSDLRPGDLVVHLEHGIGVVRGLETMTENGAPKDCLALEYAAEAKLLVPVEEMDLLWRYGSEDAKVTLDRLNGNGWKRRKAEVEAQIAATAESLVRLAQERQKATAPELRAPRTLYRRFVARFPYAETADQAEAIEAVLRDLARGRPMNRLVCGDVGFGKTEVALRAAATAVLAGKQVALAAPTTVLVRQHLQTFRDRFSGFDIRVERLSGAASGAAARAMKAGLADGSIHIVIGTHSLASDAIQFNDLGLVVIDEEQRFGAEHKERLRALGRSAHLLTMTATPIPRTLQAALVGLQDLSVIATPPVRRQPIRSFMLAFDPVVVREALLRERNRGGQSFVVCPRIKDLEPMGNRLAELVPELDIAVAHGRMKADALDDVMIGFVNGAHDVLLATNIIEAGLDIPGANTILVWRADRFGLAQLHQLRGRVGRGRVRGIAYLLLEPEARLLPATEQRLRTLEALDSQGAGFAISARDLDLRGAGDLMGEDQKGHIALIGTELYQHLLARAVAEASGRSRSTDAPPELHVEAPGLIPADYVPDEEVRIGLYQRLSRLQTEVQVSDFAEEIEDRFGPPPEPVLAMLALARIRQRCRRFGIAKIEAGPQAVAATFRSITERKTTMKMYGGLSWAEDRLIHRKKTMSPNERLGAVEDLLRRIEDAPK